jgi:tetratricopeptide (TPR) repeat protein
LAALVVLLASVVFQVGLTGDVSRSASVAVPALLAGVMAWREWPARWAICALLAVCAANFFLPARHVVTSDPVSRIPIFYLHAELAQWRQPPDQFNPKAYNALGVQQVQAQKIQEAYAAFTTALGLDPGFAPALVNRGVLLFNNQHKPEALADFDRAVALDPQLWDARYSRALALGDAGESGKAVADLEYLLAHAPADWPNLAQAKAALAALRARGVSP